MAKSFVRHVMVVIGTRPEAIKLAPVVHALRSLESFKVEVCAVAQQRTMLDQALRAFNIAPDLDLDIMQNNQDLTSVTTSILKGMKKVLRERQPVCVIVQGDTTTTFAASLAAFYEKIPVAHVEAGLRTGNVYEPWPEEVNRRLASVLAELHFAPTVRSKENLLRENIAPQKIHVTGNTIVDAVLYIKDRILNEPELVAELEEKFSFLDKNLKIVLVTGHRRENFGKRFKNICLGLQRLAKRSDVQIVYPVHLNPNVQKPVYDALAGLSNVHLLDPLGYIPFVYLMHRSHLIITDSGGIQEEAPSLGKPVLVMRRVTERPEAVSAGNVKLVGCDPDMINFEASELLENQKKYMRMAVKSNPFGDGRAAHKIARILNDTSFKG